MLKKLAVLTTLIGGGAGGAWFMLGGEEPGPGDETLVEEPVQAVLALHDAADYIKLPAITIPTFRGNELAGRLVTEVTLETSGGRNVRRIEGNTLILRDAFTSELFALAEAEADGRLTIDHDVLKTHLRAVSNRLLGADVVSDVLIRTFVRSGR